MCTFDFESKREVAFSCSVSAANFILSSIRVIHMLYFHIVNSAVYCTLWGIWYEMAIHVKICILWPWVGIQIKLQIELGSLLDGKNVFIMLILM